MTNLGKPLVCWWQCDWRPSGRTAQSDTINAHVPGVCVIESFIGLENPLRNFTTRVTERRKPCIRFFLGFFGGGGGGGGGEGGGGYDGSEFSSKFCDSVYISEKAKYVYHSDARGYYISIPLRGSSCRLPSFLIYSNDQELVFQMSAPRW